MVLLVGLKRGIGIGRGIPINTALPTMEPDQSVLDTLDTLNTKNGSSLMRGRGRGRPRKVVEVQEVGRDQELVIKRGRGRPRKNKISFVLLNNVQNKNLNLNIIVYVPHNIIIYQPLEMEPTFTDGSPQRTVRANHSAYGSINFQCI